VVANDRELWAAALMVLRQHSGDAHVFAAERLGALAQAGDAAGVQVRQGIAKRISAMVFEGQQSPN